MSNGKPLSLRLADKTQSRLAARSAATGERRAQLLRRYAEEGLRMDEHPGIVFRSGPAGRRAGLAGGPDVWTVISVMRDLGVRGEEAIGAVADHLELHPALVQAAVRYYADYKEEIDELIRRNEEAAERAREAWQSERAALAG